MPNRELYARLHVSSSASAEEIRKAFLYWSGVAHPDKHLDPQVDLFTMLTLRRDSHLLMIALSIQAQAYSFSAFVFVLYPL